MTNDSFPRGLSSRLADQMAQLLEREERKAVVGDLLEGGDSAGQALFGFWA